MPGSSGPQEGTDMRISKGVLAASAVALRLPSFSPDSGAYSGALMLPVLVGALALPNIAAAEYGSARKANETDS